MTRLASEQIAELIRSEYSQLPGLNLTFWQAQRLWNVPEELCRRALTILIKSGYLTQTADGGYVRAAALWPRSSDDSMPRAEQIAPRIVRA